MKYQIFLTFIVICVNSIKCTSWSGNCRLSNTINITDGHKDGNGNFIHQSIIYKPGTYGQSNSILEKTIEIPVAEHTRGCVCLYKPCIRLCCSSNECANDFTLIVSTEDDPVYKIDSSEREYGVLTGNPCKEYFILSPMDYDDDQWLILKNGSISLGSGSVYSTDDYCINQTKNSDNEVTIEVKMCFQEHEENMFKVYPIGMVISIIFLIITFSIYAFIPELRNLHGKCLMCYIFGLANLYFFLTIVQLNFFIEYHKLCTLLGYCLYFSVFLSFVWLSIICFDIWRTYKRGAAIRNNEVEKKEFLVYCINGFGIPTILTALIFLIDTTHLLPHNLLPKIGHTRCWIGHSKLIEAIYVFIPISIMMLINIALFLHTISKLGLTKNMTVDGAQHMRNNSAKYRFFIYIQLFILMGIFWCMESISWMFDNNKIAFYVTDFINCLQGVWIFIICVMKSRTRKLVAKRCCALSSNPIDSGFNESSSKATEMI